MSDSQLAVALIGYGLGGSVFHAPLIACTPGLRLATIVTSNQDRAKEALAKYPDIEVAEAPEAIWRNAKNYDIVVVATPNKLHAPLAKSALNAGLHVVVDKPMCVTSAEASDLIDVSKHQGKVLSVYHNRRWDSDFLTVKSLIESGKLGTINRFESRFERYRPVPRANAWRESSSAEDGGGLLFDLGSHLLDQCVALFGMPDSVFSETDIRRPGVRADDDVFLSLSYANGLRAHIYTSALSAAPGPRFRINGTLGSFVKYGLDPQEDALRAGTKPDAPDFGKEGKGLWGTLTTYENDQRIDTLIESSTGHWLTYYRLLRDAVVQGAPPPVPAEAGLQVLQLIESARRGDALAATRPSR